jgi:hypothetical protein
VNWTDSNGASESHGGAREADALAALERCFVAPCWQKVASL